MQNQKPDSHNHRPIYSCNVYKTTEETRPPPAIFKSWNDPEVLFVNEKILKRQQKQALKQRTIEISTQTSKTILQLARMETRGMSPDSLSPSPRHDPSLHPYSVNDRLSDYTLDGSCHEQDCYFSKKKLDNPLTQTFLEKNRLKKQSSFKSRSFVESYHHPNYISPSPRKGVSPTKRLQRRSSKSVDLPDNSYIRKKSSSLCYVPQNTFMFPTRASQIKSKMEEIQSTNYLIPPMRRGRSTSPKPVVARRRLTSSRRIPYIDQSRSDVSSSTTVVNATRNPERIRLLGVETDEEEVQLASYSFTEDRLSLAANFDASNSSVDTSICAAVNKIREPDWRIALKGLAEIVEICRVVDIDLIYDYMTSINQRLIELLRSPRSHVCRTACQAAGHLFEYVKDTRRPEFDDIVDLLLSKTADANKFIRQDANLALDCMVTHISTFNAVRALCHRGPIHKNPLVRTATVRLLVCVVVIAGAEFILNPSNNEYTRKRIILNLVRFLEDKNLETRKMAERLYKVLGKEPRFDVYLRKYLEKEQIAKIKKTLKLIHKK